MHFYIKVIKLRKEYAQKVIESNENIVQQIHRPYIQNDFIRVKDLEINKEEVDGENSGCKNKDAEVAIIVGRQNDILTAKKITKLLDRLKITYDMKVVCPIRSHKKFINYVKSMKNAKIFIGVSSNSSHVTGGLVGLTARPVIGVPCTNEYNDNYLLTTVSMPPGVPVATVGVNHGKNAAVLAGEIFSIGNPELVQLLEKLKDKKISF